MSITCFIFPADPKLWESPAPDFEPPVLDLKIDVEDFKSALMQRFPHSIENEIMQYQLNSEGIRGIGVSLMMSKEAYQTVVIEPFGVNLVEFILWYREYVPNKFDLYYFCSHSFDGLKLTSATTIEDINTFMSTSD